MGSTFNILFILNSLFILDYFVFLSSLSYWQESCLNCSYINAEAVVYEARLPSLEISVRMKSHYDKVLSKTYCSSDWRETNDYVSNIL